MMRHHLLGTVARSVTAFNEVFNLDANGKIGHNLSMFSQTVTLEGNIGRDFLGFFHEPESSILCLTVISAIGSPVVLPQRNMIQELMLKLC
jgi:hypothetical protein